MAAAGTVILGQRLLFCGWYCTSFQRGYVRIRSYKQRVGTDLFAICSVLGLHSCFILVSGAHSTAILQEMVYVLFNVFLFLTEKFPHRETTLKVITFSQINHGRQINVFVYFPFYKGLINSDDVLLPVPLTVHYVSFIILLDILG